MVQEVRTRCHTTVRQGSAQVKITRPNGVPVGQSVEGDFKAAEAVSVLISLPLGSNDQVKAYGQALFERLFGDTEVKSAFAQCENLDSTANVQVCIEIQDKLAPELRGLRWEALCDHTLPNPRRLAVEKPFRLVRRLSSAPKVNLQPLSERPRVLVVISNPKNLEEYQTPEEKYTFKPIEHFERKETKALDALMHDLEADKLIQGYQILGGGPGAAHLDGYPSLGRIRQVLEEALKTGQPHHILHFLAHGYLDKEGKGHLILTDDSGNAVSVAQDDFLNLFPPSHMVRLVVFAACQSDQQVLNRPLAGLAPSMLQKGVGIPAVIAMQDEISVGAASEFTRAFYRDLGQHGYIDTAMANARAAVAINYAHEWYIPVLYLQNDNPRLFDPFKELMELNDHEAPFDEELWRELKTLYADKQSRKQQLTRADLFCRLVRCRLEVMDPAARTRVNTMIDDFEQRLNGVVSPEGFVVTDGLKDLLLKAHTRAKKAGKYELGVLLLMEVVMEDPGDNIIRELRRYGLSRSDILTGMRPHSLPITFDDDG